MPRGAVVLTGAGRGFGAALAVAFAEGLAPHDVDFVLLGGRAAGDLADTARALARLPGGARGAHTVACHAVDLSDPAAVAGAWASAVDGERQRAGGAPLDFAWLVHNAGSLGPLGMVGDLASGGGGCGDGSGGGDRGGSRGGGDDRGEGGSPATATTALQELVAAVHVNVTSAVWLSSLFLGWARARVVRPRFVDGGTGAMGTMSLPACAVVNVSSLAATQPFKSMGVYSVVKAARDMLGAVIAAEGAGGGRCVSDGGGGGCGVGGPAPLPVAVLSYAPGPMDTAMQAELRRHPALDAGLRASFADMARDGAFVDARASAAKCFRVLAANRFRSGAHLDWYDDDPDVTDHGLTAAAEPT